MPPRIPGRPRTISRPKSDPTVSIASAASAKLSHMTGTEEEVKEEKKETSNDDLKKLIEALKNKLGSSATPQKQAPPQPKAKWNRSIEGKTVKTEKEHTWNAKPAYTVLSRVSNHEMVPQKSSKQNDPTINALPHSFLYRPGADGITVDKLNIKAGKQLGMG